MTAYGKLEVESLFRSRLGAAWRPRTSAGRGEELDDDVVRGAPLFAGLGDEVAAALLASMSRVELWRGDVLFKQGDSGERLFVITSGKIKLGRTSNDGRENLLTVLGPGEMFGELSLLDPGPRTATATAVSDARLVGLGNTDLQRWLTGRPEVARQMLQALARRLRRTNDSLADMVFCDVPSRVAKALLDLSSRFGRQTSAGVLVPHELTQEELAQLVGTTRETANKALGDFANRGWIRLEERAVVLLDVDRLRRRAR